MTKQPRVQRRAVSMPAEHASGRWARSMRLSGFAITALGLIVLCIVVLAPSLKIYIQQTQRMAAINASNVRTQAEITALNGKIARWSDPAYVQAQARSRLNYVFPGDYSYIVTDATVAALPVRTTANGQPISKKIQSTQVDWVSSLLSSVITAGLTEAPINEIVAPVIITSK